MRKILGKCATMPESPPRNESPEKRKSLEQVDEVLANKLLLALKDLHASLEHGEQVSTLLLKKQQLETQLIKLLKPILKVTASNFCYKYFTIFAKRQIVISPEDAVQELSEALLKKEFYASYGDTMTPPIVWLITTFHNRLISTFIRPLQKKKRTPPGELISLSDIKQTERDHLSDQEISERLELNTEQTGRPHLLDSIKNPIDCLILTLRLGLGVEALKDSGEKILREIEQLKGSSSELSSATLQMDRQEYVQKLHDYVQLVSSLEEESNFEHSREKTGAILSISDSIVAARERKCLRRLNKIIPRKSGGYGKGIN